MMMEASYQKATPTAAEENSRSKTLHRWFLISLKTIPMVMAGLFLLNTVLSYFDIDYSIISYLTGVGLIPWLFIMLASYALKFCEYHRMFLWYIIVNNVFCWVDYNYGILVSDRGYLIMHFIIAGIFLFLVLYFHQKCKNSKT